jgi:uncharacterized membrane protein
MVPMQKLDWFEFLVSLAAVAVVLVLVPWFGDRAHAGFALLGILVFGIWFVRKRGQEVVSDERDRSIEQRSKDLGVGVAWMYLFITLSAIVFWSSLYNGGVVPTRLLTLLIWTQFAVCYSV